MSNQIGAAKMRKIGKMISQEIPGLGFAMIVFEFENPCIGNYISNAQRSDMIVAMEETIQRFKEKQDFKTPEEN